MQRYNFKTQRSFQQTEPALLCTNSHFLSKVIVFLANSVKRNVSLRYYSTYACQYGTSRFFRTLDVLKKRDLTLFWVQGCPGIFVISPPPHLTYCPGGSGPGAGVCVCVCDWELEAGHMTMAHFVVVAST